MDQEITGAGDGVAGHDFGAAEQGGLEGRDGLFRVIAQLDLHEGLQAAADLFGIEAGVVAADEAFFLQPLNRRAQGVADRPTCSARSVVAMRPSRCRTRRILRSMLSRSDMVKSSIDL